MKFFSLSVQQFSTPLMGGSIRADSRAWYVQIWGLPGGILDFRKGQAMVGLKLDDVLTDLEFTTDRGICLLIDEQKNAEFLLGFDRAVRELVVYTPPGRADVISLEPYTQTTDAINLQARGVAAGLRILGHGAQDTFVITMETRG